MEKRLVKSTGDAISILGYGAMRFPTKLGLIDEEKAMKQLRYAINKGVNYIDTAYFYHGGQSETFLGKALRDGYREKVYLATKMPPWLVHTPNDLSRIFENQLKKLQTDFIDYYLLHALNRENWDKFKQLDALNFLQERKAKGQLRHIGFSFHGDRALFKEIIDAFHWDFCQIQYNLLDEYVQAGKEGLKYAASKDIAVFIMEPLRGGTLAKNIPSRVQELYNKYPIERTPVEWALKWIWSHPEVTMLLSGMTEDQHIVENISYAQSVTPHSFSDEDLNLLEHVKEVYKQGQKVPCTACQYCMPCPVSVDIPRCFELYNAKYLLRQPVKTFYWMQLGGMNGQASHASLCVNCGKCVALCPQSIAIPERLNEVAKDLEGPFMVPFVKLSTTLMKKIRKKGK